MRNLSSTSLLTLKDLSADEIRYLLDLSLRIKKEKKDNRKDMRFSGKNLAILFEKRSTRTRCAFQTAFGEEGGNAVFLSNADIHLGAKETLEDTARVLGRMFDAVAFRGFKQLTAEVLSEYSGIPVVNGLTDSYHPTQGLADFMTMQEEFGEIEGKKLCYLGDGRNNVARTLMIGCVKLGIRLSIGSPKELQPDAEIVNICKSLSGHYTDLVSIESNPQKAVSAADAVYTDVWVSMGEEDQEAERLALLSPYRVTEEIMEQTGKDDAIFLHCLPAVRGNEVSSGVMDGPRSRIWDQAENRKHTIKAVLLALCGLD